MNKPKELCIGTWPWIEEKLRTGTRLWIRTSTLESCLIILVFLEKHFKNESLVVNPGNHHDCRIKRTTCLIKEKSTRGSNKPYELCTLDLSLYQKQSYLLILDSLLIESNFFLPKLAVVYFRRRNYFIDLGLGYDCGNYLSTFFINYLDIIRNL
ncbi:hypothetical protein PHYBLDRAFT_175042 [Phycomyces blakesleeanus NRRL 1555(-)]|uniref:Uncharacterized protein n=1 Tax=Phycomyces blakesleeanus (strain ATCC 8743b / DSM 1359 / FGSC 10004 / NBRC 33097 / NRRL 1555) TaxID=763407 RepID=A0A162N7G6_PHYB8|nr:hypothetical protein PHYBLDRAFT_175042 [Phycomyces blakesleeanus NRRL 1555(-)]OAD66494.1 hypothetical protein PHYBLDRAFT_175042 [Phycomyces blakesleeanus NRRL 1555(-)]|eukprot:XP_018284534.1 hypothetical protein PHYBLDRAFT_175042 [Phycomyces blakesleeanus NRRL 1555(-)]